MQRATGGSRCSDRATVTAFYDNLEISPEDLSPSVLANEGLTRPAARFCIVFKLRVNFQALCLFVLMISRTQGYSETHHGASNDLVFLII